MRKACGLLLLLTIAAFFLVNQALASPLAQQTVPYRDDEFEREVLGRLTKISPEAVPVFQQATADSDARNYRAAKAGFERVLQLAPNFPDALRRLASIEIQLNLNQQAVEHARGAYAASSSPTNATQLAAALLSLEDPKVHAEALALAKAGAAGEPGQPFAQLTLVLAAAAGNDEKTLRRAVADLLVVAPDSPASHYFAGLLAMEDSKWAQAREELLKAKELGIPENTVADHLKEIDQHLTSAALQVLWLKRLGLSLAAWFVTFGMLFAAGLVLSRITLVAVRRPRPGNDRPGPLETIIRSMYGGVIALTSVFFYVSLPLLAVVIVLGVAGIVYVQLLAGRVILYLLAAPIIIGFYTVLSIVRSVFVRGKESEPGRRLTEADAPRLWTLVREVADQCRTRPPDAIYLTPAVEVAVMERGRLLQKLRGKGSRYLIIGLGTLPEMTVAEFAAILAHEYGHFSNRDTAGGNLAYQVNLSMHAMAYRLASAGMARWYNPAWWFIRGFSRLFYRTTLGASRLREILADRFAAVTYGGQNLIDGLTRIIRQDLAFDVLVDRSVRRSVAQNRPLPNLYAATALTQPESKTVEARFAEVMSKPTSSYDSHPAVSERIRLIRSLQGHEAALHAGATDEPVSNLFSDIGALQQEMIALIQGQVNKGEDAEAQQRAAQYRQAAKGSVPEVAPCYERLAQAVERHDHEGEAAAWGALAEAYEERELYSSATNCWENAAGCYANLGDQESERVARYNMAQTLKDLQEWGRAEAELMKVVALDEATQSPDLEEDRVEQREVAQKWAAQATTPGHRGRHQVATDAAITEPK